MNSEREKADILFDYGLPLQFCCRLIQFYTLLFLRVATLSIWIQDHGIQKTKSIIFFFFFFFWGGGAAAPPLNPPVYMKSCIFTTHYWTTAGLHVVCSLINNTINFVDLCLCLQPFFQGKHVPLNLGGVVTLFKCGVIFIKSIIMTIMPLWHFEYVMKRYIPAC